MSLKAAVSLVSALALATTLGSPLSAGAVGTDTAPDGDNATPTLLAQSGPLSDHDYVVVNPAAATQVGDEVFFPTGEISDETLVIVPNDNGQLPFGLAPEQIAALHAELEPGEALTIDAHVAMEAGAPPQATLAAIGSGYSAVASAWGPISQSTTALIMGPGGRTYYAFDVAPGTSQVNSGNARGYYRGYNGGQFWVWQGWYLQGTASSNSVGGASNGTPWYNVSAFPAFQGQCATTQACYGKWWINQDVQ